MVLSYIDRYNSTTGIFTVPVGGLYYFSTHLAVDFGEYAYFNMRVNNETVCTAFGDDDTSSGDFAQGFCSAIVDLIEGNIKLLFSEQIII